jgi:ERF superfamily
MNDDTHPLRSSPTIAAVATALSKAQAAFPPLTKDRLAEIETRSGGRFSYGYVDLSSVIAAIRAPLAQNEIAVVQAVALRDHHIVVETTLAHSSGEWLSSELAHQVADGADPRSVGSLVTYLRRFSLVAMVAVAAGEDDDGAEASARTPLRTAKAKVRPRESAAPVSEAIASHERAPATPAVNPKNRVDLRPVTDAQLRKLWHVAKPNGWTEESLREALSTAFGIRSIRADLRQGDVDQALAIAHRRPPSARASSPADDTPTVASASEEPF